MILKFIVTGLISVVVLMLHRFLRHRAIQVGIKAVGIENIHLNKIHKCKACGAMVSARKGCEDCLKIPPTL